MATNEHDHWLLISATTKTRRYPSLKPHVSEGCHLGQRWRIRELSRKKSGTPGPWQAKVDGMVVDGFASAVAAATWLTEFCRWAPLPPVTLEAMRSHLDELTARIEAGDLTVAENLFLFAGRGEL